MLAADRPQAIYVAAPACADAWSARGRFMPFIDMHRKKHSELRAWKRGTLLVFPKL
ncbi:hypothetical protein [Comamonas sp. UBA7528]|jgi:hypothetical protein|uniref:hypothetical protein n=1 Tax=Comamonas sp. UBA7528 TaxID=1946391 RepID=UPI0025C3DEF7|nr:hypothetical protein [Comamonas sp. UBA7528]